MPLVKCGDHHAILGSSRLVWTAEGWTSTNQSFGLKQRVAPGLVRKVSYHQVVPAYAGGTLWVTKQLSRASTPVRDHQVVPAYTGGTLRVTEQLSRSDVRG